MVKPSRRRAVVDHLQKVYAVSERCALRATGFNRSSQRYRSKRNPQIELRMRLKELAWARVRYGYRRLHVLLRREGWSVNHKRIYRLYLRGRALHACKDTETQTCLALPIGGVPRSPASMIAGRWIFSRTLCSTAGNSES